MRNTHLHEQVGVSKWAIQDSNLCNENATDSIKNAENDSVAFEGVSKSASLVDRSEQVLQLLALLQGVSIDKYDVSNPLLWFAFLSRRSPFNLAVTHKRASGSSKLYHRKLVIHFAL
jgi:hypothetical protein